jgi:hypothetical protein
MRHLQPKVRKDYVQLVGTQRSYQMIRLKLKPRPMLPPNLRSRLTTKLRPRPRSLLLPLLPVQLMIRTLAIMEMNIYLLQMSLPPLIIGAPLQIEELMF